MIQKIEAFVSKHPIVWPVGWFILFMLGWAIGKMLR